MRLTSFLFFALASPLLAAHDSAPAIPGVQSLDVTGSGKKLHLLLGEAATAESPAILNYQSSDDGGETWSKAVRVDADNTPAAGLHRGMDAQIAASGEHLISVWQTAGTDSWGGGPMATAVSSDQGKTWKRGPNPADDGSTEGHNFIDIAADGKGVFHLVWLDTRQGKRGLRSATSADFGVTWSRNRAVDEETCECCWNTIATSSEGGAWVIYRDKGPRDMAVAALGGANLKPSPAGKFQWQFEGCPHVGAGLAYSASDRSLNAAVWSGKEGRMGIYYLRSSGLDNIWSEPFQLGNSTARNPDCAANAQSTVAIVWNSMSGPHPSVQAAFSASGGKNWTKARQISASDRTAWMPRVISTSGGFRCFWTETKDQRTTPKSALVDAAPATNR